MNWDGSPVKPIAPETVAAFRRELPSVPLDDLCRIAEFYQILASDKSKAPAEMLAELAGIDRRISSLMSELQEMDFTTGDAITLARAKHGGPSTIDLINFLRAYLHSLWMAERYAPQPQRKRPASPRAYLVKALASVLASAGLPADAKPTGPLAKAVRICLDHTGERVSRIPVVIANALK